MFVIKVTLHVCSLNWERCFTIEIIFSDCCSRLESKGARVWSVSALFKTNCDWNLVPFPKLKSKMFLSLQQKLFSNQGRGFFFSLYPRFSLSSSWPHFNCLLKWTMAWHFCKTPPFLHPLPPSLLSASFLLPLSLIHTHIWYCLWAAINHVSGASSQKGEASTRSPLPVLVPGKRFQRTHGGWGGGLSEGLRQ